ncbi:DNA repair protein UVH3 [Dichanthelium oligosanthes]|uniref:DNA repair protein UVH3 n=1 Tax=Dichanthelium oligosanthes TaxID=888268 RepID=A0A1E5V3P4_9POAL|nr:DNA repair protein UVH3 [Dichanthelium oligosanthes]
MGVHGLWELLAPVGRRVSVETLAGKRVAVDASIWMVQFMRAMRDDSGEMIRDAHLLGFLRRICKLLFLRVRPVFVFDGATPVLKRRTLATRRRHRDAAQAKVRKTAEKLLLSHLKSRKLEELAEQIRSDRAKHDAKGKQVGSSREEEYENTNQDQNQNGDTNNSDRNVASINQEKMDEMYVSACKFLHVSFFLVKVRELIFLLLLLRLAASLAAEEETGFTGEGKHHFTSLPLQEGAEIDEDEDDDEGMIFPMTTGDIDPAVLASLPPSMQLDLLVQMRERVMAENRQKYQKIKKEPAKFSELQIQSYLKTVAFRQEIDQVQKCAAAKGVGGVQTSKIASEANREFIFSTSFTGDKQMLAQRGGKEQIVDNAESRREINSAVFRSNPASSSVTTKPSTSKHLRDFGPDVETYRDERGRIRVSRVRAMGIRMTRDIQRNLDFIKENEQVKSRVQTNVHKGSTVSEEPPDFPEHLFESNELQSSLSLDEELLETAKDNHQTSSVVRGSNNISESSCYGNKETIEICFMDDQTEVKDNYDDVFLHLASGTASDLFSDNDCLAKKMEESEGSECIWEEGVIEGETLPMKVDENDNKSSVPENCSDDEVEWEEGDSLVPGVASSSEHNTCNVPKGDLEEDALVQEAIRRSLEDLDKQASENVTTEDMQASVEDKSLQFSDDVSKLSEAPGETTSHSGAVLVKETNEESRTEINSDDNDVIHGNGLIGSYRQENENQPQLVNNDGHVDMHRAHLLESLPLCTTSTSNLTGKTSDSSKANGDSVMISRTEIPETPVDDYDKNIEHNSMNSSQSKCSQDVVNIGEILKSPQKDLLVDEPVADTTEPKENAAEGDLKVSTSEINYTQVGDNDDNHGISANYLDEELSRLRQEQIDLGHERRKLESHAESVSSEMFAECQELLQMFGLPYIIAPMEAEAQCAYMEMSNLVDGVVTDDSDVFLFGARNVYKNIFDDRKYVETYFMKDIESELGLTRQQLIRMALLLGSDYTEGVSGIGIVNAIEVVHAFPEEDGLQKFKEWIESPDPSIFGQLHMEASSKSKKRKPGGNDSDGKGKGLEPECNQGSDDLSSNETERIKEIFMSTHRNVSKNWHIPAAFPSDSVISAYITPQVDNSTEPFSWGRPDLGLLRKLCWERFGWGKEKANELLLPVLREYNKHETQLRMEAFYSFNERFAKIRSKRIKKAIKGITGKTFADTDEPEQDNPSTSKTTKKRDAISCSRGRGRGKKNSGSEIRNTESLEDNEIGDPNSSADMVELTKENNNTNKRKKGRPSGCSKGRGRSRKNAGHDATGSQVDSDTKYSSASDEDSHKGHTGTYESEGIAPRRSSRKRKQVTYMEDGDEADGNDVPVHQNDENETGEAAANTDMVEEDTEFYLVHQDASELNSNQMHTDTGTAEDINEDSQGFELHEDHQVDSAPKDYLFTGGGFCVEDGDEQQPAGDRSGAEMEEPGASYSSDDMVGVSDGGKSVNLSTAGECTENAGMEEQGASSSQQRRKASRGLSAMPTLSKRRRKS